jgi:hypothetical protein
MEVIDMDMFGQVKNVVRELIDISVVLIALAIVLTILVGGSSLPFVGNVVGNMMSMVKDLGSNGVVGLIVLGVIVWLFSGSGKAVVRK